MHRGPLISIIKEIAITSELIRRCAEKTATAKHVSYLDTLQLYSVHQYPSGTIYQQDGTLLHFVNIVRTFLYEQFPTSWIEWGSPYFTWLARSPDLTLPDFFLRGFKDQVYRTPVHDLTDLQERIYAAVSNVIPQMLHNTWSRLNTGWIFPVILMEALLRFMEHKDKIPVFILCSN